MPDHELQAVRLAVAMRARFAELAQVWHRKGYDLGFGVGAAVGHATLGRIPELRVVVPMGRPAQRGWARVRIDFPRLRARNAWHPAQRRGRQGEAEVVRELCAAARWARASGQSRARR